jgi:hypothetical protein
MISEMVRTLTATVCLLMWSPMSSGQTSAHTTLDFDLSQMGMVVDGKHFCEDKGRFQDYSDKVIEQIIAVGPKAIPVLIGKITDLRPAGTETDEPIICYWYGMAMGDIAFCTLLDLFTDSTGGKTTMPGAGWNDMLGSNDRRLPAREQYNDFINTHGRKALQAKWQRLWNKYGSQMYWDAKERCFRLKAR